MNFLTRELIINDHERFAKSIREKYQVDNCEVIEKKLDEHLVEIGYKFTVNEQSFEAVILFEENESNELAIKEKEFRINQFPNETFTSLGHVFEKCNINKNI